MAQLNCPACHGAGGETNVILDDGTGPWEECGFCRGTGKIEKGNRLYYQVLGWLSAAAKRSQRNFAEDLVDPPAPRKQAS